MGSYWDFSPGTALLQLQVQKEHKLFGVWRRVALGHCVLEHQKATFNPFCCHSENFFHLEFECGSNLGTEKLSNIPGIGFLAFHLLVRRLDFYQLERGSMWANKLKNLMPLILLDAMAKESSAGPNIPPYFFSEATARNVDS